MKEPIMAEEFSVDEFRTTVGQLHTAMENGANQTELLKQCLDLLGKCSTAFDRMQRSQGDVAKALRRLEGEIGYGNDRSDALLLSMQALLKSALRQIDHARGTSAPTKPAVGKSRWLQPVTTPAPAPEPASVALNDDPDAIVKKGLLLQTVRKLFGPRGGQAIAYDPERAWKLQAEGVITKSEADRWKKLGRLPDRVNLAS
jgi:hypothetical protein